MSAPSRTSYRAFYADPLGRPVAVADYGTNGGTALTRPVTAPSRNGDALVSTTAYNDSGQACLTIDPKGTRTALTYDQAGQLTRRIDNCDSTSQPTSASRVAEFAYNADGKLVTLTAWNSATGDQLTRFVYGVSRDMGNIASNDLLRTKIYPDDTADTEAPESSLYCSDRVEYSYNALGELTSLNEQRGTVHDYEYDNLGRLVHDRVTSLGDAAVDGTVRRLSTTYGLRGLVETATSYDAAGTEESPAAGNVVNQVEKDYNDFGQLEHEWQAQVGAVVKEGDPQEVTPPVIYAYADGSANTIRPTALAYPDGRTLAYSYGTSGEINDALSRVETLTDNGTTDLVSYDYLGAGQVVRVRYLEPAVDLTYIKQTGESNGDAGDQYTGLDRFGRIVDQRWFKPGSGQALERLLYGFDQAGNRLWGENQVANAQSPVPEGQDELYTYDNLYQLTNLQRGVLDEGHTALTDTPAAEEIFTYDQQGNWGCYQVNQGGASQLNQTRDHNLANEITAIATSAAHVGYDAAGNMTTTPKPGNWSADYTLRWDAWNRLVQVSGLSAGLYSDAYYRYDGQHRRVTTQVGETERCNYFYSDRWQLLQTTLGEGSTSHYEQWVWGLRHIDDVVLRDRDMGGTSERLYALHDHLSVTALVGQVEEDWTIVERYGYTAFGQARVMDDAFAVRTASLFDWETRFHCYHWDGDSGFYQVRHRSLHAELGRWSSRDELNTGQVTNLYFSVSNNPIGWIDPMGKSIRPSSHGAVNTPSCYPNQRPCITEPYTKPQLPGLPQGGYPVCLPGQIGHRPPTANQPPGPGTLGGALAMCGCLLSAGDRKWRIRRAKEQCEASGIPHGSGCCIVNLYETIGMTTGQPDYLGGSGYVITRSCEDYSNTPKNPDNITPGDWPLGQWIELLIPW